MKFPKFKAPLLRRTSWSCLLIPCAPLCNTGLSSDLAEMRKAHRAYLQHFVPPAPDDGKLKQITPPAWDDPATRDQCRVAWSDVETFLDKAEAAHSNSRDYALTASAGYSGDSAGSSERSKASIESELKAGSYPGQFRMKAGASLDFKSDDSGQSLTEDVTSILINYDHYLHPNREGFAFMERFYYKPAIDKPREIDGKRGWQPTPPCPCRRFQRPARPPRASGTRSPGSV